MNSDNSIKNVIKRQIIENPGSSFDARTYGEIYGEIGTQNAFHEISNDFKRAVKVYRQGGKITKLIYYGEYDVNKGSIINKEAAGNTCAES